MSVTASSDAPTTLAEIEAAADSLEVCPDVVVIADEHALPGSCTPLGDGRFIVHPADFAELKVALDIAKIYGPSPDDVRASRAAVVDQVNAAITGRDSRIGLEIGGEIIHIGEPTHIRDVSGTGRIVLDEGGSLFGDPPAARIYATITEPTYLPGGVIDRRYVLDEGGSLHGPGWSTAQGIQRGDANGGSMWTATTKRTPVPNTAECAATKKRKAKCKRLRKLAKKSRRANR